MKNKETVTKMFKSDEENNEENTQKEIGLLTFCTCKIMNIRFFGLFM
jgi:hypothetical protein